MQPLQGYLTADDISLFYKQGYVHKKNCLTQIEVSDLKKKVSETIRNALDFLKRQNIDVNQSEQFVHIDGTRVVYIKKDNGDIFIQRMNGCTGMTPGLMNYTRSLKLTRTFFEILDTKELEHIISQIHPKKPNDGVAFPKHRDIQFRKFMDPQWTDVLGNGSYAICMIPVDRMSYKNGGLWIDRNNFKEKPGIEDRVWIDAKPGDLLFMHPELWHGSEANTSNLSRRTLLTGYCAYGANHEKYPGADVNVHLTLTEEDEILMEKTPWAVLQESTSTTGH